MCYDLTQLPGAGNRLVVDGVPVLFANLVVVQIVTQDTVFVFGLLPPKEHRGVRVSDGQDRVRWSGNSWNVTKNRNGMEINYIVRLFNWTLLIIYLCNSKLCYLNTCYTRRKSSFSL